MGIRSYIQQALESTVYYGSNSNRSTYLPPVAPSTDTYFSNVSILLHGDGTNNSTTFTDSGPSPKTITRVGNTIISTSQSKFGGASIYFDQNDSYLSATSSDFTMGTGDYTVELWALAESSSTNGFQRIFSFGGGTVGQVSVERYQDSTGTTPFMINTPSGRGNSYDISADVKSWNHVALTRNSGTSTLWVNGQARNIVTDTTNHDHNVFYIGGYQGTTGYEWFGYLDEIRVTKGIARYTTTFTPPTQPF